MLYNYNEVYKKYGNDFNIMKEISNKKLYKISRGIYSDKKNMDWLPVYSKKYSQAVITLDSAFYYYKLTDVVPQKVHIAIPRHAFIPKDENLIISYIDKKIINEGKTLVIIDNEKVAMYDKERLLIELIRKRNKIPFDYYKEIILNYRKISNKLDMRKIEKYMSLFKNKSNIEEIIIREVF